MRSKRSQIISIHTAWFYLHEILNQKRWIHSNRNQDSFFQVSSGCLLWVEIAWKVVQGNFWNEGHIWRKYPHWGGGHIDVCICKTKIFKLYISDLCISLYIHFAPMKRKIHKHLKLTYYPHGLQGALGTSE